MNRAYVSEYTLFMNRFLEEHPEAVDDQRVGRAIYWDRQVDLAALERAEKDSVPQDGYGFYYSAWRRDRGGAGG